MLAEEFISHDIFPLKVTDKVDAARIFFEDWNVFQLPVVQEDLIRGYVALTDIEEAGDEEEISAFIREYPVPLPLIYAHLFEIIRVLIQTDFTTLPLVDAEGKYKGIVSYKDIYKVYRNSTMLQPGAIITLNMNTRDYSLSELARIIESNDHKIIHLFLHSASAESSVVDVSLKLNTTDVKNILISLERYGYKIVSVHQSSANNDADMSSRYDWLMKFINS